MFDLVLCRGLVLDGTGAPATRADVGVTGGRIAAVGRLAAAQAGIVIDAADRYVVPGFIDTHVHADAAILEPTVQLAALRQGVTTLILGQDGLSFAPATPAALAFVTRYFAAINGSHPRLGDGAVTIAELLDTWRGTTAVNTAFLVPHGTVRFSVLGGAERPPEPGELAEMRRMVERGLAEGAVGLSTGLEYLPGRYAGVAEVAELSRPVAEAGLPYVTHMRGYGAAAATGFAEARAIGMAAGVAVHISHYHGPGAALLSMVDDARSGGLDLTFDSYPYLRACTILAMAALPRWLDDTDLDRTVDALSDPTTRRQVIDGLNPDLLHRITLAHVPDPDDGQQWSWTEGWRLIDAAAEAGVPPAEFLVDLLVHTRLAASAVIEAPPSTDEESMRALLRHPAHMAGSDGIYVGGHPHPRGWGAFARLLERHVRELGDWTWEQAAVHLASHPARRFGLIDRGIIRPGLAADLAVIDPVTVSDRADYTSPREVAVGVNDVIVNGVPVLRDGHLTGNLAGTPLTPRSGG